MIQEIITYIIIAWAVIYSIYGALKLFGVFKKKASGCACNASCSSASCAVSQ